MLLASADCETSRRLSARFSPFEYLKSSVKMRKNATLVNTIVDFGAWLLALLPSSVP